MIQNLRKGGIIPSWCTMWKGNQVCDAPRFLGKTMIDTNSKNHCKITLAIMQMLGCNHFKEHPSYSLSEPASAHLMSFFVQSSITLPPALKCSSRGSQSFRMDAKAPQPHYCFLWLSINRVPFQGLLKASASEKQPNEAINKTEPLTQHIPVRSRSVKASELQKKVGQREWRPCARLCWASWCLCCFSCGNDTCFCGHVGKRIVPFCTKSKFIHVAFEVSLLMHRDLRFPIRQADNGAIPHLWDRGSWCIASFINKTHDKVKEGLWVLSEIKNWVWIMSREPGGQEEGLTTPAGFRILEPGSIIRMWFTSPSLPSEQPVIYTIRSSIYNRHITYSEQFTLAATRSTYLLVA